MDKTLLGLFAYGFVVVAVVGVVMVVAFGGAVAALLGIGPLVYLAHLGWSYPSS